MSKEKYHMVYIPIKMEKTLEGKRIFVDNEQRTNKNDVLIKNIKLGFKYKDMMEKHDMNSKELSKYLKLGLTTINKRVRLTLLAPDIIDTIIFGEQPLDLSMNKLLNNKIPVDWKEQRKMFGYA